MFTRKGFTLFAAFMGADDKEPVYRLMKEALPEIKCPFEQLRLDSFSEGFWERYEKMTSEVQRKGRPALEAYLTALEHSLGDHIAVVVPNLDDDGVIVSIDHVEIGPN